MTLDDLVDPKLHSLVTVARRLIEERCARGVASPAEQLAVVALAEQLAVVALAEQPDEGDEAAVRAWQPTSQFRAAVRLVATATLAHYVGVVEGLADEADRDDDGGVGETLH